jgi:two-component system, NarL family, invasion response regulator UvrY
MKSNKILIADDHSIVRSGLKLVIKEILPWADIDEALNGDEVISFIKKNQYALIVLDINMPDTDSISLVANLLAYRQDIRILIFSINPEALYAERYLKMGVKGYLNKNCEGVELKRAIHSILEGKTFLSNSFKEHLRSDALPGEKDNPFKKLSDREMQVAKYFLLGYSYAEIQKILNVQTSTIGTLKMRLFGKLNIKTMFDLGELARLYDMDASTF